AAPMMARLDGSPLFATSPPRVAVVGAGAFGGWTALHLLRRGAQVTLIDAWGPGNARSSSGGESRVIRAIYGPDRVYVEMVKRAFELWTQLDAASDDPLYVETGALWLHRGDDAYVRSSVPILRELGFPVEQLALADATRRWPQIDFGGVKSVWLESRAGALSAARACIAVRHAFTEGGGVYRTARVAPGLPLRLEDGSRIEADAYVFACGPWLGRLFPDVIGEHIRPTRQEVYYFGTPPGSQRYLPAALPIWIDFGRRIIYGIPDVHGRGFKVADDTRGAPFDPTDGDRTPTREGIARARRLLAERFPELAKAPLIESQVCQYENSPDGHLIIDRHPEAKNVWLVGGGSGHGFKLSPAVGEMVADAVLTGKEVPKLFRIDRLKEAAKPKTQFEGKD
ncbi:MAG TPA: FAD-dependent oxidoreductase, partial [Thermoanaerobaculia bacterium]|nr:FAD-dependent oxidoreductase [Thermoanaerobaculia bacterium]